MNEATKKKRFAISSLFKRKPTELEALLMKFLKGDGYNKFAKAQSKAMQEQKEIERKRMLKDRYDYLNYRISEGLPMTDTQQEEFEYVSFLTKKYRL